MKAYVLGAMLCAISVFAHASEENTSEAAMAAQIECEPRELSSFFSITRWCPQVSLFDPSARIYFDTGEDDEGEVDIFDDGSLSATIDFASLYFPFELFDTIEEFTFGPSFGVGISGPAQDSKDGSQQASSAPVFLMTGGLAFRVDIGDDDDDNSISFEFGRAIGFSADESFGDNNDSATYVGFKLEIDL